MKHSINPTEIELKEEAVIAVNRVAKVVKGGRRFSFNALVTLGDGAGIVGVGMGKANEVSEAINKAKENAKRNLMKVPLMGSTIPFEVFGRYGAGKVLMKPASPGTGIIAGGPVRLIMEMLGVHDLLSKSKGSNNPHNIVKAVINGLSQLRNPAEIAGRRGRELKEIWA